MVMRVDRGFERTPKGQLALRRRPDLFVSHNSRDKDFAKSLSNALNKIGVDVFLDCWELEAGDSLHRSLAVALEESRFIAVVISPDFLTSEWCSDELSQALEREKRIKKKLRFFPDAAVKKWPRRGSSAASR
jgi:TIR domain